MKTAFQRTFTTALAVALFGALSAVPASAAAVAYRVTVDTTAVNGSTGFIDLQFNPGNVTSQPAIAQVESFTAVGGVLTGVPQLTGDITGALPGTVKFVNDQALNDYFHGFNYGTSFTFLVVLSGPALDAPNGIATAGSTFCLGLYDAGQLPILTNQGAGSGCAGTIDVNLNGTTTPTAFPTATNGPSVVTFAVTTIPPVTGDSPFQISYAANLTNADSLINIVNTGANGASLSGPGFGGAAGNLCVNVYAFSPDEQEVACCSCLITPNGLASLSVQNDLISNTLTGVRPNSIVIKLVATLAGGNGTGTSCTNSAATVNTLAATAGGMVAWSTTTHAAGSTFATTESPFKPATLSQSELSSIANRCVNIVGNGSTFGICRSCRAGALGAGSVQ